MTQEKKELSDEELKQKVDEILDSSLEDKDKIKRLHDDLGYSQVELCRDFGFPRATVYRVLPARPKGKQTTTKAEGEEDKADESKLPLVLKTGKGTEMITPEGIMRYYLLGDGELGAARLEGMMLLRAAQLMVMNDVEIMKGQADAQAAAIKPILDIMEKAREDMDAAAVRAKESGAEIAAEAAAGAAAKAVVHIDQKFDELKKQKADLATVENPMQGFMARAMETMWERMLGIFSGGSQSEKVPGLVDERAKG